MINLIIHKERVDTSALNTVSDKCDTVSVTCCEIDGSFFSNINSLIYLGDNYAIDTIFVIREDWKSRMVTSVCKGIRPVSIVSGYAYTHQITSSRRYVG